MFAMLAGCGNPPPPVAEPPEVTVAIAQEEEVQEYIYFSGVTEASERVEIRARVTGFLEKVMFKNKGEVTAGQPIFLIEPKPFQIRLDAALAMKKVSQERRNEAKSSYDRALKLSKNNITPEELENKRAIWKVREAEIEVNEAAIEQAKIDLGYTKISAPISGVISKSLVDETNLVSSSDATLLATIVQNSPMKVTFDISEDYVLRFLKQARNRKDAKQDQLDIHLGLDDEGRRYPHMNGKVTSLDIEVDKETGTLLVEAEFPNKPESPDKPGYLIPGIYVRLRLPLEKKMAFVVLERALGTDLDGKFLLVLDKDDKVRRRGVDVGAQLGKKVGGVMRQYRVVTKRQSRSNSRTTTGLENNDRYIVAGLQKAIPGRKVRPVEQSD